MGRISKSFALILILIMTTSSLSMLMVKSASAQTLSTPTFSVNAPSATYQVPTTYSTDPYTGSTVTKQGYTVNSINITFTIQNTHNTSFYVLQYKGHFGLQWSTLYEDGYNITTFASSEPQTFLTIFGTNSSGPIGETPANEITFYFSDDWAINLALGSQLDFRLRAVSGSLYVDPSYGANHQLAVGSISDWSKAQTVTVPTASVSPTPSPTVPELPTLIILPLFAIVTLLSIVFSKKKLETNDRRIPLFCFSPQVFSK